MISSYLEVEKLVISYFAPEKQSQLIGERNKQIAAIWTQQNVVQNCQEQVKRFFYMYLKSEKLFQSNQEYEKNVLKLFGSGKYLFLAISSLTNTVAAIWREK